MAIPSLCEEILIDFDYMVAIGGLNTDTVLNHEACQSFAINQNHSCGDGVGVSNSTFAKPAGGDENPGIRFPTERTHEGLDVRSLNPIGGAVPLRLNIHSAQSQDVLVNYPVYATIVSQTRHGAATIGAAVTHPKQKFDDCLFEEFRLSLEQPVQ
jgi:hypothetical protein